MSIGDATSVIGSLHLTDRELMIAERVMKEINARLRFLCDVGLDYLTLARSAATLAGGEAQRIRLASQIGSGLVGVLYVLDEPTIGLHQRDNHRLIGTLEHLRDIGNTVLVVEHDEDTIKVSDWVVDVGAGAGEHGGEVVYSGPVAGLLKHRTSMTGQYLSGRKSIRGAGGAPPAVGQVADGQRRPGEQPAEHRRRLPARRVHRGDGRVGLGQVDARQRDPAELVDAEDLPVQDAAPACTARSPGSSTSTRSSTSTSRPSAGRPRSNPATYTGVFDDIRRLFASTTEAKVRGYQPGRFSFNVKGGRCENCARRRHDQDRDALPARRLRAVRGVQGRALQPRDARDPLSRASSIAEVLDMPCEEAVELLREPAGDRPATWRRWSTWASATCTLGQSAPTLSGGEAQRVKLATELAKRSTGHTLYILDEPTTGLHFEDVRKLLGVLYRLVDQGNTVLVIEHNLDVIKTADWIIDLGPEGGSGGGLVVAEGTAGAGGKARRLLHRAVPGTPARPRRDGQRQQRPVGQRCPRRGAGAARPAQLQPS